MSKVLKVIDKNVLKSIHEGEENIPTLYFHDNYFVRWLFYDRLNKIANIISKDKLSKNKLCVDFGGGSGVFLPTLSGLFNHVILIDLETRQAKKIKELYHLENCEIIEGNIFDMNYSNVDYIIAADVIEHFKDTNKIINKLQSFMNDKGSLMTSLPSENSFYRFLRFIFKQTKPEDHFYSSFEIRKILIENDFKSLKHYSLPFFRPFCLFDIDLWRK